VRELGTSPSQSRQALVGYLCAVAEEQPLHLGTCARPGAAAQSAQHAPDGLVTARVLAAQCDRPPQDGLPREVLPSMTHGRARAQVCAVEVREHFEHQLISKPVKVRRADDRPGLRPPVLGGRRVQWQVVGVATATAAGH